MTNYKTLYQNAIRAALVAVDEYLNDYGDCGELGYAWVTINPASNTFGEFLVTGELGQRDKDCEGCFCVWEPGAREGMGLNAKEAGASAFASVLKAASIDAYPDSELSE